MSDELFQGAEQVRDAEVIGALCLATDLGTAVVLAAMVVLAQ